LHEFATGACFQDNQQLIDWVQQQPLSDPLTCLAIILKVKREG